MAENEPATVVFDVGGKVFKVSRSVIGKHPESMLAKVSSPTWQADPDAAVFVDADSERFRYCLDYLRTGRVFLPLTASKVALLHNLDYFGIENVNPDDINGSSASLQAAEHLAEQDKLHVKQLEIYDQEIREIQRKRRYVVVAHECFKMYSRTGSMVNQTFDPDWKNSNGQQSEKHRLYEQVSDALHWFDDDFFNKCLAKYGLHYIRHERYRLANCARYGYKITLGQQS